MAYIYCYTNKVNGKKYIGQTNNPERRKREHKSNAFNSLSKDTNIPFYNAIRKYGLDGFTYEILLETETPNQDEVRLIMEHDSIANGYNVSQGGQSGYSYQRSLTDEEACKVREMIKEGKNEEIKREYGISDALISNINQGLRYFSSDEIYPLKKYYREDEDYNELLFLLRETDLSFPKIAKQLGMGVSTVKKINYGKLRHGLSETYPIRPYSRKPVSTIPKV